MANGQVSQPSWTQLLNVGVNYVREAQPAWIYIGINVAMQIVATIVAYSLVDPVVRGQSGFAAFVGFVLGLGTAIIGIYLTLMLARHALTGEFSLRDSDHSAMLRIIGLGIIMLIGAMILIFVVVGGLTYVLGNFGLVIGVLMILILGLFVGARLGFYVPALSVGHETSITEAYAQSEPYWVNILLAMIGPWACAFIINWAIGRLFGLSLIGQLLTTLIGGTIVAAAAATMIASISYLYANFIRSVQR